MANSLSQIQGIVVSMTLPVQHATSIPVTMMAFMKVSTVVTQVVLWFLFSQTRRFPHRGKFFFNAWFMNFAIKLDCGNQYSQVSECDYYYVDEQLNNSSKVRSARYRDADKTARGSFEFYRPARRYSWSGVWNLLYSRMCDVFVKFFAPRTTLILQTNPRSRYHLCITMLTGRVWAPKGRDRYLQNPSRLWWMVFQGMMVRYLHDPTPYTNDN